MGRNKVGGVLRWGEVLVAMTLEDLEINREVWESILIPASMLGSGCSKRDFSSTGVQDSPRASLSRMLISHSPSEQRLSCRSAA